MKIALWQTATPTGDDPDLTTLEADAVERALDAVAVRAREAAEAGAVLLIAPELALSGYNIGDAARRLAEPADGPAAERLSAVAAETGVAILIGAPERGSDGAVYNAALFTDPSGARAVYRKAHLYGPEEKRLFAPGTARPPILSVRGLKVAPLICYDVEFPEMVRAAADAGADLIAVPTALMRPMDIVAETLVVARAYESGVFVAYVNRCGREAALTYVGKSCLIAPDGSELARAGADEEALLIADVDPGGYEAYRREAPYLADLRRDLYPPPAPVASRAAD
ncbi:MAG: carbon-nitrogen hydrolase family protein [Marivibrio sp.]|uniref:carbon-nitrogen hydrolase family protein n=1 Tax=Marivibrio sp. TaxID=2039719 RepID=UPI0032EEC4F3